MVYGNAIYKLDECIINHNNIAFYEFDLSETINNIKKKIKEAILSFIDNIDKFLDKCKDNTLKTWAKGILIKVRKLLTKSDNINNQDDAKKVSNELNEYSREFENKKKESSNKEISNEFAKTVEKGDVVLIRSVLIDYLIIDTSFEKFNNGLEYAKSKVLNLIEEFYEEDGDINEDKSSWNNKYLNMCKTRLFINFSTKRINHLKKVIKYVLKDYK